MQRRKSAQVNAAPPAAAVASSSRPPSPTNRRARTASTNLRIAHLRQRFRTSAYRYRSYGVALFLALLFVVQITFKRGPQSQLYKPHYHSPEHELASSTAKVYIYELPDRLQQNMLDLHPTAKHDNSRSDIWVFAQLTSAPFRTYSIETASLFYIPIFPDIYFERAMSKHQNVSIALAETVNQYLRPAFEHMKAMHPSWRRGNGRGHFTTLSHGLGRCAYLAHLQKEEYGEMFFIQHLGALALYNGDSQVLHTLGIYQQSVAHDKFACYRSGWDVLLPPVLPKHVREAESMPMRGRKMQDRILKSLYRFDPTSRLAPSSYYPNVPGLLSLLHEKGQLQNADWRVDDLVGIFSDMQRAAVCITPSIPGQANTMFWVALEAGCIPVTFLNAEDQPFGSYIDYSSFSINVQPYEANSTQAYIDKILQDKFELKKMQHNLHGAQDAFSWKEQNGLSLLLKRELSERGRKLARWAAAQAENSQTKCITIEPGWTQCW